MSRAEPIRRRSRHVVYLNQRIDHMLTQEFAKYRGQPNASRNMRAVVKQYNPLHYIFGTKLRRTSHESE